MASTSTPTSGCRPTIAPALSNSVAISCVPRSPQDRLCLRADGRVLVQLKTVWRDGTSHFLFDPIEFLEKLAGPGDPPCPPRPSWDRLGRDAHPRAPLVRHLPGARDPDAEGVRRLARDGERTHLLDARGHRPSAPMRGRRPATPGATASGVPPGRSRAYRFVPPNDPQAKAERQAARASIAAQLAEVHRLLSAASPAISVKALELLVLRRRVSVADSRRGPRGLPDPLRDPRARRSGVSCAT